MTDASDVPEPSPTAGGLLRRARQARGLHIAALATSIKVSPHKLELLETDRLDELPGAAFTRALAQTVCRSLKTDPAPVLALLPQPADHGLDQMSHGLNAPFRDKSGQRVQKDLRFVRNPAVVGAVLLLLAAGVTYLLPAGWVDRVLSKREGPTDRGTTGDAASNELSAAPAAVPAALPAASAVIETAYTVPAQEKAASEPAAPVAAIAGVLQLRTTGESWIEVLDGRGAVLLSRLLSRGEAVGVNGVSPLRVRIGNGAATTVTYRGNAVDLAPFTRNNVVTLELK